MFEVEKGSDADIADVADFIVLVQESRIWKVKHQVTRAASVFKDIGLVESTVHIHHTFVALANVEDFKSFYHTKELTI